MFSRSIWMTCIAIVGSALVISGCKPTTGGRGVKETLQPDEVPFKLSERFEDGQLIVDARFDHVQFRYDSFQVDDGELAKVKQVFAYMQKNGSVRLVVEGNCDERGSREYNVSLGENRALAVRASLIGMGIDGARIQTKSFGEERPLDPGHDESAWRLNRRAEFKLYR